MSEIQESVEILKIMSDITIKLGGASMKALQFIFAQMYKKNNIKEGERSLKRMFKNCAERGVAPQIMNIATEDAAALNNIKEGLKSYGIQFAVLEDYKEDGYTQIMIPSDQISLFKAFIEKNIDIECKEMSMDDYYETCPPEERDKVLNEARTEALKEQKSTLSADSKKKIENKFVTLDNDIEEITLNPTIFKETDGKNFVFLVPQGSKVKNETEPMYVFLSSEDVKKIMGKDENGKDAIKSYSALINKKKEYPVVKYDKNNNKTRMTMNGNNLFSYFSDPFYKGYERKPIQQNRTKTPTKGKNVKSIKR